MDTPQDEVYKIIRKAREASKEVKRIAVPAELYEAAYLSMHDFYMQPGEIVEAVAGKLVTVTRPIFPLPVPPASYTLWGVEIVKAE